ncbi:tyrosine-type recombinase/integrase [Streptomyces sp. MC1]|uniref:tyrosine-type recombinase/integrase n=1 Tax=Streptomyces sp. MC1 TaxID=295105 RepID=UPI0018CAD683|nr:tyrosine-type recombinase/integrase [Streptomyces sp. MC1]MBG7704820.1 tyrosine-type recombinase/integrase [Streptomyces sp. MC1]
MTITPADAALPVPDYSNADGRSARGTLVRLSADPRDDWPPRARRLYDYLAGIYGAGDVLPTLAAAWLMHQRSDGTRKTYAQNFKLLEEYARRHSVHPLKVTFLLADAFAQNLETLPTMVWRSGARVPEGPPRDKATRHNVLSGCSSFYKFVLQTKALPKEQMDSNPFEGVLYPVIDPMFTRTEGLTEEQFAKLARTARDEHQPRRTAFRLYVLLLTLYHLCLRIDAALGARIERLGHDRGHHVLEVEVKGGYWVKKAVPPSLWHAIQTLIEGRTEGFIFITSTGKPLDEPSQLRAMRSVAKRAELPQKRVGPHGIKHATITHALARPGARPDRVQEWADHNDPRTTKRYNRRRGALDGSPAYDAASSLAGLLGDEPDIPG